jgi:hypothetical protein
MIDHHAPARTAEAFRLEAENLAFRMGHLTCTFERIAQQADELRMRRELAWARACEVKPERKEP